MKNGIYTAILSVYTSRCLWACITHLISISRRFYFFWRTTAGIIYYELLNCGQIIIVNIYLKQLQRVQDNSSENNFVVTTFFVIGTLYSFKTTCVHVQRKWFKLILEDSASLFSDISPSDYNLFLSLDIYENENSEVERN